MATLAEKLNELGYAFVLNKKFATADLRLGAGAQRISDRRETAAGEFLKGIHLIRSNDLHPFDPVGPVLLCAAKHFIQVPSVARTGSTTMKVVGVGLTALQAPTPDNLIGQKETAHRRHLCHVC